MPLLQKERVGPHAHSFVRYKIMGNPPEMHWKCADPHCLFVVPGSLISGKASLCPNCLDGEVILNKEAMRRKRPVCLKCQNTKEGKAYRAAQAVLDEILEEPKKPEQEEEETMI